MPRHLLNSTTFQWHQRIWLLALPIILSNISVPLVGAVDTAVMGHLPGAHNLGAVALGASIFSLVFWTFGFLRMASGGVVAQFYGAANDPEIGATLLRYGLFAVLAGLLVLTVQRPLLEVALYFLSASSQLEDLTRQYFEIRIWAAPATFLNYVLLGTFIGLQRTAAVLILQLVLNLSNVALDLIFVVVMGYGITGVALASVISECLALLCGLALLWPRLSSAIQQLSIDTLLHLPSIRRLLAINADIFLRTLLLVGSTFYLNAAATRMGEVVLAANAILLQLLHLCAYTLDGFAHAAETLTGQAFGARDRKKLDMAIRISTLQATILAFFLMLLLWFFGDIGIRFFTDQADVIQQALVVLPWLIAMPLVSVWSYQLDGIFIGTTHTRQMRNGMAISALCFVLCAELLQPRLGNHGLWLAFTCFSLCRAITLLLYLPAIRRQTDQTALATTS